jgi:hypothetical protein
MNESRGKPHSDKRRYYGPPPSVPETKRSRGANPPTDESASEEVARRYHMWLNRSDPSHANQQSAERAQRELYQLPPMTPCSQAAGSQLGTHQDWPDHQSSSILANTHQRQGDPGESWIPPSAHGPVTDQPPFVPYSRNMLTGEIKPICGSNLSHGDPQENRHSSHKDCTSDNATHQNFPAQTNSMTLPPLLPPQIPHHKEDKDTQTYDCVEQPDGTAEQPPDHYGKDFDWNKFNCSYLDFNDFLVEDDEAADDL